MRKLFDTPKNKPKLKSTDSDYIKYADEKLKTVIKLRRQVLLFAYAYYELDMPMKTDSEFDAKCIELVDFVASNPDYATQGYYWESFLEFDGSTGYYLPYNDLWIIKLYNICKSHDKYKTAKNNLNKLPKVTKRVKLPKAIRVKKGK